MIRSEHAVTVVTFASELHPEIASHREGDADTIAWADANPVAWEIVRHNKSKAYGKGSSDYLGCGRDDSPGSVIYRTATLRQYAEHGKASPAHGEPATDFWRWRARFTLTHYRDRGFRGGLFQQYDGEYDRGCCLLDYTPATLPEVIRRFLLWCGPTFPTVAVKVDRKVVLRDPCPPTPKEIAGAT